MRFGRRRWPANLRERDTCRPKARHPTRISYINRYSIIDVSEGLEIGENCMVSVPIVT